MFHFLLTDFGSLLSNWRTDPPVSQNTRSGINFSPFHLKSQVQHVITSTVIMSTEQQPATNGNDIMKLFQVCDRKPKIKNVCPDNQVMRIAWCEFDKFSNRTIKNRRTGKLYTNREYQYDLYIPDLYINVCKYTSKTSTTISISEKAPGFVTMVATLISIFALASTLLTYSLFSVLRNLPGWNTINLTLALIIAEILFLMQSILLTTRPLICLLMALGTHYFFLASFFWMNIMAFDLWQTFHKGFSLYISETRERLPFYALYAWGSPIIIVLIGIILDANNARLKPCYGRFFRGCYDLCFRTRYATPLQGCWIESALMRFLLFGIPVAIILIVNFIFYALTVHNIRRTLKKVRVQIQRKFKNKKQIIPGEHDVKIYTRIALITGFGWTIGFINWAMPDKQHGFLYFLSAVFQYSFILLNATTGIFIFVVFVCNRRVLLLYHRLIQSVTQKIVSLFKNVQQKYLEIYYKQTTNNHGENNNQCNIELRNKENALQHTTYTHLLSARTTNSSTATYRTWL
ncbi:unnamed protein product [Didymodactylos carnosus]|uniref:G-protein coupled receptors family 2 profile 2 domain-containing protein n=1 Tax=Didymodactylos carnosus TaxID=1234261 RepID=A0A8S2DYW2_9BILA|nr:unnamed protein product [Didymodactylos carnosus]CAF3805353.1 unnamed protein product [Didymodactylos carnosus]